MGAENAVGVVVALPGFTDHPKFRRLVHLLRVPVPHAWGYCECLWQVGYAAGEATIGDATDVELACQWPGEPGVLCRALLDCHLIDEIGPGVYAIHDLAQNAPQFIRRRMVRAEQRRQQGLTLSDVRSNAARSRYSEQPAASGQQMAASESHLQPAPVQTAANDSINRAGTGTEQKTTSSPAGQAGREEEPPDVEPSKKPRQRRPDDLWDAVVEVTGSDPKVSRTYIGRVCSSLRAADPPYTPAEVRLLPPILASRGMSLPPSLGTVEKYIGWVRHQPAPASKPTPYAEAKARRERMRQEQPP